MKYIKAYENIIKDLFKRKLPKEVVNLGEKLTDFINNNIVRDCSANYSINYAGESPILSIYIDPHDEGYSERTIGLYYNQQTKTLMVTFIKDHLFLKIIQEYIEDVMKENCDDFRGYLTTMKEGNSYWIRLQNIENFITQINQKDYDLFLTTKNYNI